MARLAGHKSVARQVLRTAEASRGKSRPGGKSRASLLAPRRMSERMTVVAAGLSATKSDVGQEQESKENPGRQCVLQSDPGRSASDKLGSYSRDRQPCPHGD